MKKLILSLAAATAMTLAASSGAMAQMDKVKACFIYVGPIGDFGWSYQHHQGLLAVEEALGDKVETAYLESVPEGADAERAIERFARSGCNIIFTTSFGYMDATNKALGMLRELTQEAEIGKLYLGVVKRTVDFGAFIEIFPGTEGLVHISHLANERVDQTTDVVNEGDEVLVRVIDIDKRSGKIRLSRKEALEAAAL